MPDEEYLPGEIREAVERNGDRITDLLIRQLGLGHHAAIIALAPVEPRRPSHYKALLAEIHRLSHVTIEVELERADWVSASGHLSGEIVGPHRVSSRRRTQSA